METKTIRLGDVGEFRLTQIGHSIEQINCKEFWVSFSFNDKIIITDEMYYACEKIEELLKQSCKLLSKRLSDAISEQDVK